MIVEVKVKDGRVERHDASGWYFPTDARYFTVMFASGARRVYPWNAVEWVFADE